MWLLGSTCLVLFILSRLCFLLAKIPMPDEIDSYEDREPLDLNLNSIELELLKDKLDELYTRN